MPPVKQIQRGLRLLVGKGRGDGRHGHLPERLIGVHASPRRWGFPTSTMLALTAPPTLQGAIAHIQARAFHPGFKSILEGNEIRAAHAILASHVFLARPHKGIEIFNDFRAGEARFGKGREIACRLQSTRDSADPELNVVERRRRQLGFDHDIGELYPPAGTQDAVELGEDTRFFRAEIVHAIRDCHVH